MCIICVKPSNVEFPAKSIMKTCFENNPDGAGFAFPKDGEVQIYKGFMSFKKFWRAFRRFELDKSVPVVFHFRIATSAGINRPCTHPFPVTQDYKSLQALTCTTDMAIAHNGVLSNVTPTKTLSDTMVFIRDYLSQVKDEILQSEQTRVAIEKFTAGSKFAVLNGDGDLLMMGSGWIQEKGLYFSNDTFEYRRFNWNSWYEGLYNRDSADVGTRVKDDNGEWQRVYGSGKSSTTKDRDYYYYYYDWQEDRDRLTETAYEEWRRHNTALAYGPSKDEAYKYAQSMLSSVPCPLCDGEMMIYNEDGLILYHCLSCDEWLLDEDVDALWRERETETGERAYRVAGCR